MGENFRITLGGLSASGFKSSKTTIATVNSDGEVHPIAKGSAKITITLANKKKLTLTLTVNDPTIPTAFALTQKGTVTVDGRYPYQLTYTIQPAAADRTITWKSSKPAIATVDNNGLVTAHSTGKVTITATTAKGKKSAKVTLNIVDATMPAKLILDQKGTVKLDVRDTLRLTYTLQPATAETDIRWQSSNTSIATVDGSGIVTPHKAGKVTITAITTRGKGKATVKLNISDLHAPTKLIISEGKSKNCARSDGSIQLHVAAQSAAAPAVTTYQWSSTNTKVATVDQNGRVTFVGTGKTKITVASDNNKKATITLTIK